MQHAAGVEILLHNLSHSDLVLECTPDCGESKPIMARPKFSHFRGISEQIWSSTISHTDNSTSRELGVSYMKPYSRTQKDYLDYQVPIGISLDKLQPVIVDDLLSSLRFRSNDYLKLLENKDTNSCTINSVHFPLIALLIPKWLANIDDSGKMKKKVVVLVSGRGTPRY